MAYTMPRPIPPGPVEIDDSRLRDMWARHHQRSLFTARAVRWIGVAAVLGIAAVLTAIALAFWALERKPPVVNVAPAEVHVAPAEVNVAPAEVHVTVPPGPPPVVNVYPTITAPNQTAPVAPAAAVPAFPQVPPPPASQMPENKIVTDYVIFHYTMVDGYKVESGWKYHSSNDTAPYMQFCNWYVRPHEFITIGQDGALTPNLAEQASDVGADYASAVRYFQSCQWSMI